MRHLFQIPHQPRKPRQALHCKKKERAGMKLFFSSSRRWHSFRVGRTRVAPIYAPNEPAIINWRITAQAITSLNISPSAWCSLYAVSHLSIAFTVDLCWSLYMYSVGLLLSPLTALLMAINLHCFNACIRQHSLIAYKRTAWHIFFVMKTHSPPVLIDSACYGAWRDSYLAPLWIKSLMYGRYNIPHTPWKSRLYSVIKSVKRWCLCTLTTVFKIYR